MHHVPLSMAAEATGLVLAHGSRVALSASDFAVPLGASVAVIGPNGSGKSTLLHALAGLLEPVAGRVLVLGRPPGEVKRRVAYVLQATKVNETMPVTVREVVAMGRYAALGAFRPMRSADRAAIDRALERLDLIELRDRHLRELSGGQRQRVFVAQGLAQAAEILLLDEPLTALDLGSRERIRTAMADEQARGATVFSTTHDLSDAGRADHVLLLNGQVVAEGPPDRVLSPARLEEVYGIRPVALDDGSLVLDDPFHRPAERRHVHYDRSGHADHAGQDST